MRHEIWVWKNGDAAALRYTVVLIKIHIDQSRCGGVEKPDWTEVCLDESADCFDPPRVPQSKNPRLCSRSRVSSSSISQSPHASEESSIEKSDS